MTGTMDEATFKRVKKVLSLVWGSKRSDFYREKYRKAGFDSSGEIRTPEDFLRLPALTRDDLAGVSPFERFYWGNMRMSELTSTSGTTARLPILSLHPLSRPDPGIPRVFRGVSRILILNQSARVAGRFLRITDKQKKLPIIILAGDPYNLPGTAYIAGEAGIDAINSTITLAIKFAESLKKYYDPKKIRSLRVVGELATPARSKLLRELYPNAKIHAVYGLSEAHSLGRLCGFLGSRKPIYHANPDVFYEIIDGELIVTNLDLGYTGTPLIRYKTGDAIAWAKAKCACAREGKQFVILGRINRDFIKIAGGEIWGELVEKVVGRLPAIQDFRIHIFEVRQGLDIKARIVFEILPQGRIENLTLLAAKLASLIPISPRHSLFDAEKAGLILPLEARIVDSFPVENKAGRIIFHES